eukprot:gene15009-17750_t
MKAAIKKAKRDRKENHKKDKNMKKNIPRHLPLPPPPQRPVSPPPPPAPPQQQSISTNSIYTKSQQPSLIIRFDESDSDREESIEFDPEEIIEAAVAKKRQEYGSELEDLKKKIAMKEEAVLRKKLEERLKSKGAIYTPPPADRPLIDSASDIGTIESISNDSNSIITEILENNNDMSVEDIEEITSETVDATKDDVKNLSTEIVVTNREMVQTESSIFQLELEISSTDFRKKAIALKLDELRHQQSLLEAELVLVDEKRTVQAAKLDSLKTTCEDLRKSYRNKIAQVNQRKRKFDDYRLTQLDLLVLDESNSIVLTPDNMRIIQDTPSRRPVFEVILQPNKRPLMVVDTVLGGKDLNSYVQSISDDGKMIDPKGLVVASKTTFMPTTLSFSHFLGNAVSENPLHLDNNSRTLAPAPRTVLTPGPYISPLVCLRSYRFSANFSKLGGQIPLTSATYSNKLNPKKMLCMYEVDGVCLDQACPFQHARDYTMTEKEIIEDVVSYASDANTQFKVECLKKIEGNSKAFPETLKKAMAIVSSQYKQINLEVPEGRKKLLDTREQGFTTEMGTWKRKKKRTDVPPPRVTVTGHTVQTQIVEVQETEDFLHLHRTAYIDLSQPQGEQQATTTKGDATEAGAALETDKDDPQNPLDSNKPTEDDDSFMKLSRSTGNTQISRAEYLRTPKSLPLCFSFICSSVVTHNQDSEIFWKIYLEVYSRKHNNSSKEIDDLLKSASNCCNSLVLMMMRMRLPSTLAYKVTMCESALAQIFSQTGSFKNMPGNLLSFWTLEIILIYIRALHEAGWRDYLIHDLLAFFGIDKHRDVFIPHYGRYKQRDPFLSLRVTSIRDILLADEINTLKLALLSLILFNTIPQTVEFYENTTRTEFSTKLYIINWTSFFASTAYFKNDSPKNVAALQSVLSDLSNLLDTEIFILNNLYFFTNLVSEQKMIELTETALKVFPNSAPIMLYLASIQSSYIKVLEKAVDNNSQSFQLLKELMIAHLDAKQHSNAIKEVDRFILHLFMYDKEANKKIIREEKLTTQQLFNLFLRKSDHGMNISITAESLDHTSVSPKEIVYAWLTYALMSILKNKIPEAIAILRDSLKYLPSISDQKLIWKELLSIAVKCVYTQDIEQLVDQFYETVPCEFNYPFESYLKSIPHETPSIIASSLKPPVLKDFSVHNFVFDLYSTIKNDSPSLIRKSLQAAIEFKIPVTQISKLFKNVLSYYPYNYDLWMNSILFESRSNNTKDTHQNVKNSLEKALLLGVNLWSPKTAENLGSFIGSTESSTELPHGRIPQTFHGSEHLMAGRVPKRNVDMEALEGGYGAQLRELSERNTLEDMDDDKFIGSFFGKVKNFFHNNPALTHALNGLIDTIPVVGPALGDIVNSVLQRAIELRSDPQVNPYLVQQLDHELKRFLVTVYDTQPNHR